MLIVNRYKVLVALSLVCSVVGMSGCPNQLDHIIALKLTAKQGKLLKLMRRLLTYLNLPASVMK